MLVILAGFERFVVGDVFYYHRKINALFTAGLDRTLFEYPTPVVWILWLPYGASFGNRVGYLVAFVIFMLALDALFTYALWRATGRRHDTAIDFWLIFVPLIGPAVLPALRHAAGRARRRGAPRGAAQAMGHRSPDRTGCGDQAMAGAAHRRIPVLSSRPATSRHRFRRSWASASP